MCHSWAEQFLVAKGRGSRCAPCRHVLVQENFRKIWGLHFCSLSCWLYIRKLGTMVRMFNFLWAWWPDQPDTCYSGPSLAGRFSVQCQWLDPNRFLWGCPMSNPLRMGELGRMEQMHERLQRGHHESPQIREDDGSVWGQSMWRLSWRGRAFHVFQHYYIFSQFRLVFVIYYV